MARYFLKRFLLIIPVLVGVAITIFTILFFTPGDPAITILGTSATEEELDECRHALGIDRPYIVQLGNFLYNAFIKWDFGTSYTTMTRVSEQLSERIPYTLAIGLYGILCSVLIGVPLGVTAAVHQGQWQDKMCMTLSMVFSCVPGFWLALMLIVLFSLKLGWLPPFGIGSWKHYVIPLLAQSITGFAGMARQTRSSMLEVIRSDYVTTARAQGYSEKDVIYKHALPNALIPIITIVGGQFAHSLGGTVVLETIFSIPGVGLYVATAITQRDYPVVRGCVLFLAIFFGLVMFLVDLIYALVDPRIKAQYENAGAKKRKKGEA